MPSKRFEEFLKNASPELKTKIIEAGKESTDRGTIVPRASEYSDQSPDRQAKLVRGQAAPPQPSYDTSSQPQSGRRIDRAIAESREAKSSEPSKDSTPERPAPSKEPER